jgi:hypothetical protein
MSEPIIPKAENATKGFHYTVADEQIKEHQKRSIEDIFEWLEKKINSFKICKLQKSEKECE